jgi:RNA polymerase sigma-70 factor (ECF subfamily)
MRQFKYDPAVGSFKGWLFQLTRWRIADQLRKRRSNHVPIDLAGGASTATEELIPDALKADWEKRWDENILDVAIEKVKQTIPAKQFQIFDLYVLREWPPTEVARALGISTTQVYLARFRVLARLKAEIKRLESELL